MKYLTVYYDNDWDFYATKDGLEDAFADRQKEDIEELGEPIYSDIEEWLQSMVYDGWFTEYTAELSNRSHVFAYYYIEESETVITAKQLYAIYAENYASEMSFSEFLDIPTEDKNAVKFYGFDTDELYYF